MPLPPPVESNVKTPPGKGDPKLVELMTALTRSQGWGKIHAAIWLELERRSLELQTGADHNEMLRNQGKIAALRWVLNLPGQLCKQAGGQVIEGFELNHDLASLRDE